jgi:hypothetical protein
LARPTRRDDLGPDSVPNKPFCGDSFDVAINWYPREVLSQQALRVVVVAAGLLFEPDLAESHCPESASRRQTQREPAEPAEQVEVIQHRLRRECVYSVNLHLFG